MKFARLLVLPIRLLSLSVFQPVVSHAEGGTLSISGVIWQDTNADGVRQDNEPGMPNIPMELGTTYNGQYFYTNASGLPLYPDKQGNGAFTDANGAYTFDGLNPGPYSVRVFGTDRIDFFVETYPLRRGSGEYSTAVTLDSQPVKGIDFGLVRPTDVRVYRGLAWLDAASVPRPVVRTFVDGHDCTASGSLLPTDLPRNAFVTAVLPSSLIAGCGGPGKTISFTINGRTATETVEWSPPPPPGVLPPTDIQAYQRWLDLSSGVPFGYVVASADYGTYLDPASISAEVNGVECGRGFGEVWATIYLIVASDKALPGCGVEGADVVVMQDGVPVAGPITWRTGQIIPDVVALSGKPFPPEEMTRK